MIPLTVTFWELTSKPINSATFPLGTLWSTRNKEVRWGSISCILSNVEISSESSPVSLNNRNNSGRRDKSSLGIARRGRYCPIPLCRRVENQAVAIAQQAESRSEITWEVQGAYRKIRFR